MVQQQVNKESDQQTVLVTKQMIHPFQSIC